MTDELMEALMDGDSALIKEAVGANRARLNQPDEAGMTPLHHLMEIDLENRADLISLMVEHGADVKLGDLYGLTPLHLAARATWVEDSATFEALLTAGANVNAVTPYGLTALHFAMDIDVVRFLVQSGADVNAATATGHSILHVHACSPDAIDFLISEGAVVDVIRGDGWTPLDVAMAEGAHEAVLALLDHGARTGKEAITSTPPKP